MYDAQKSHQTVIDLREAATMIRASEPASLDLIKLELLLARALVDLSNAVDTVNALATENAALQSQVSELQKANEPLNPEDSDGE